VPYHRPACHPSDRAQRGLLTTTIALPTTPGKAKAKLTNPFRVVRVNPEDDVIACANNLVVGRAAYEAAVRLYPRDTIQYRDGARIIARSQPKASS
jgi:hypothetical protein